MGMMKNMDRENMMWHRHDWHRFDIDKFTTKRSCLKCGLTQSLYFCTENFKSVWRTVRQ